MWYARNVPQSDPEKEAKRKRLEAFVQETRAFEKVAKAIAQVQQRIKEDEVKPLHQPLTEKLAPLPDAIDPEKESTY